MLALLPLLATLAVARPQVDITPRARSSDITSHPAGSECISEAYYGTYGGSSETQEEIYLEVSTCLPEPDSLLKPPSEKGRIVWVGPAGIDPSSSLVKEDLSASWASIQALALSHASVAREGQHTFNAVDADSIYLIRQSDHSLLLHVPTAYLPIIDTLLPAHLVPVALPFSPIHHASSQPFDGYKGVPKYLVENLANITKNLEFDPTLSKVLNDGLQMDSIRRDVRWLTGEGPSGIESRHSFTAGAIKAAHWIKDKVESSGAVCDLHHYMPGFSPNVICTYPSTQNSSEHVILSAHYDSRGSFGNTRAPGGDDDGSGSGHLLGVVEAIKRGGVQFEKKVQVAFFSGEEQGLFGSHAYAEFLHKTNETVILHIQADMLGYHGPGEPMQLGLPESIGTPEAAYLLGNLSHIYSPELVVGRTSACCSDHQSFHSFGFPATQVFERNGWILDPMYHNSGDLSQREGYDFDQIVSIAKVTMSAVLTVAGYSIGQEGL